MEFGERLAVHADVLESDAFKPYIVNRINDFQTVFDSLVTPSQHENKVHARTFPETAFRVDYRKLFGEYNNYLFA
jgi:hypothetical protein